MYLIKAVDEEFAWDDKRWLVIYGAWQPEDFALLKSTSSAQRIA